MIFFYMDTNQNQPREKCLQWSPGESNVSFCFFSCGVSTHYFPNINIWQYTRNVTDQWSSHKLCCSQFLLWFGCMFVDILDYKSKLHHFHRQLPLERLLILGVHTTGMAYPQEDWPREKGPLGIASGFRAIWEGYPSAIIFGTCSWTGVQALSEHDLFDLQIVSYGKGAGQERKKHACWLE